MDGSEPKKKSVMSIKLISEPIKTVDIYYWAYDCSVLMYHTDDGMGGSVMRVIPWSRIEYVDAYSIEGQEGHS